jgi:predicted kinase
MPTIVDATFMDPVERRLIARLGAERDAPFAGLWLEVPTAVMARRIETRGADASDANRAVLHSQLTADIGLLDWTRIAAGTETRDTLKGALAALPSTFDTDEGA